MKPVDPVDVALSFTREESFVCNYKLAGLTHRQIAAMMSKDNRTERDIQEYSSAVFNKAGLSGKDLAGLRQKMSSVMVLVAEKTDWEHWQWPTKELAELSMKMRNFKTESEKQGENIDIQNKTQPPSKSATLPSFLKWLIIGIVILLLVFIGISIKNKGLSFLPIGVHVPSPSETSVIPASTQTIQTLAVAQIPTLPPTSTYTEIPTSTFTQIPTDTFTQVPSFTPSNKTTLIPTPEVLFSDDFENGLSNQWEVISGEPLVSNGLLSTNDVLWMVVGDPSWTDLKIEINLKTSTHTYCSLEPFNPRYYTALLGLRFQDIGNMIGLRLNPCGLDWYIVKKNQYELIPQGQTQGPSNTEFQTVIATIQGNKFTANVYGLVSTTFFNDLYPKGKIALRLDREFEVDSFKIEKLP